MGADTALTQNKLMIIYITGGARSGKSSFAQKLARSYDKTPVYVATARNWDDDFNKRIKRHQQQRDENWQTIEEEKHLSKHDFSGNTVVIDCVTLWLTNFFVDTKNDIEQSLEHFKAEIDQLKKQDAKFIIISNEIGMGVHASNQVSRKFTDLQGWANQYVASQAEEAIFMVSGLPMNLKSHV